MYGAKEGGREGYRERVREREEGERDGEWEKSTQAEEREASNWGRVGLSLNWMNFCDIQWPLRSYLFKWNICVFIILVFI